MSDKEIGPFYGCPLIRTLKLNGGMLQAMPTRRDLQQVEKTNGITAAGYEVLLTKYQQLMSACRAAQAAIEKHGAETGSVIWIDPPYQMACVHESVSERLSAVIEQCEEVQ